MNLACIVRIAVFSGLGLMLTARAADAPADNDLVRCSAPLQIELRLGRPGDSDDVQSAHICGLSSGTMSFQSSVPAHLFDVDEVYAVGTYRLADGRLDADVDIRLGDQPATRWSARALQDDGRASKLTSTVAAPGLSPSLRLRAFSPAPPGLVRAYVETNTKTLAERIAAVCGLDISGVDTLGRSALQLKFEAAPPHMLLQIIGDEAGRDVWRVSERKYRYVVPRDTDRINALYLEAVAAGEAKDEATQLKHFETIRTLGRARSASDTPTNIGNVLIELAQLRQRRGEHAKAAEVWREAVVAFERVDRLPTSAYVAQLRARLGAALLRANAGSEAHKVLADAKAVFDVEGTVSFDEDFLTDVPAAYAQAGQHDYALQLLDQGIARLSPMSAYMPDSIGRMAQPLLNVYLRKDNPRARERLIERWGLALRTANELTPGLGTTLLTDSLEAMKDDRLVEGVQLADAYLALTQATRLPAGGSEYRVQVMRTVSLLMLGELPRAARAQSDMAAMLIQSLGATHTSSLSAIAELRLLRLMAGDGDAYRLDQASLISQLQSARPAPLRAVLDNDDLDALLVLAPQQVVAYLLDDRHKRHLAKPEMRWLPALEARAVHLLALDLASADLAFAEVQAARKTFGQDAAAVAERARWFADLRQQRDAIVTATPSDPLLR